MSGPIWPLPGQPPQGAPPLQRRIGACRPSPSQCDRPHTGEDYDAPIGVPVRAPVSGVLRFDNWPTKNTEEAAVISSAGESYVIGPLARAREPGPVEAGEIVGWTRPYPKGSAHQHLERVHPPPFF